MGILNVYLGIYLQVFIGTFLLYITFVVSCNTLILYVIFVVSYSSYCYICD